MPVLTALDWARLFEETSAAPGVDGLCRAAHRTICQATAADAVLVLIVDAGDVTSCRAWTAQSEAFRRAFEQYAPWPATATPEVRVIADAAHDASVAPLASALAAERLTTLAFIPLAAAGRRAGHFALGWTSGHTASDEELGTLQAIASYTSHVLGRERRDAEQPSAERVLDVRQRLKRLAATSQRLVASLAPDAVVSEVLRLAQDTVEADGYAVWRVHDGRWRTAATAGIAAELGDIEIEDDPSTYQFSTPIVAADVTAVPILSFRAEAYARAGVGAIVSIPLPVRGRPRGSIALYYRSPHHPDELELDVMIALGQLAAAAISSAELYAEEQALRDAAMRAGERTAFLADATQRLRSLDFEESLRAVANLAVPAFADWCLVDLAEHGGGLRRIAISHHNPQAAQRAQEYLQRLPPDANEKSVLYGVLRTGVAFLARVVTDEMLTAAIEHPELLARIREERLQSAVAVPLAVPGRVFGVLTLISTTPGRHYDNGDLEFASELGRRASSAIENARLYREAQEAEARSRRLMRQMISVQENERRRIARDLHDHLGQHMVAMQLKLEQLKRVTPDDDPRYSLVDEVRALFDGIERDQRFLTWELRPAAIYSLGLAPALGDFVRAWSSTFGIAADFEVVGLDGLRTAAEIELNLYRIAQEALNNVYKHARAQHVDVILQRQNANIALIVEDDGVGFDATARRPQTDSGGLGLEGMQERARLLGGTISVESMPGSGTTLIVTIPLPTADA